MQNFKMGNINKLDFVATFPKGCFIDILTRLGEVSKYKSRHNVTFPNLLLIVCFCTM